MWGTPEPSATMSAMDPRNRTPAQLAAYVITKSLLAYPRQWVGARPAPMMGTPREALPLAANATEFVRHEFARIHSETRQLCTQLGYAYDDTKTNAVELAVDIGVAVLDELGVDNPIRFMLHFVGSVAPIIKESIGPT